MASKTIGVTMGDPLGIGAEIVLKALNEWKGRSAIKVFGDPHQLKEIPRGDLHPVSLGHSGRKPTPEEAGQASVAYLDAAMAAWRRGEIDGLVTAPIAKHHVHLAGFPFPGHTEYLAAQTKTERFAMMMAGPRLKVTLVTIHEPLQKVPSLLTRAKVVETISITHRAMRESFRISKPRIAVCGLNPHAGEEGLLGREEIEVIAPAIAEARSLGFDCDGPKVPDAVFHEAYAGNWDALVCMYHDQGLIPFKMVHFQEGVNVTLGLPLVRTSPDHGTAFDIAGQGRADPSSMIAALRLAEEMLG